MHAHVSFHILQCGCSYSKTQRKKKQKKESRRKRKKQKATDNAPSLPVDIKKGWFGVLDIPVDDANYKLKLSLVKFTYVTDSTSLCFNWWTYRGYGDPKKKPAHKGPWQKEIRTGPGQHQEKGECNDDHETPEQFMSIVFCSVPARSGGNSNSKVAVARKGIIEPKKLFQLRMCASVTNPNGRRLVNHCKTGLEAATKPSSARL